MPNRHPHIRFAASPDLPQEASPDTATPVAAAPVPLPPLLDPVIAAWLARAPQQLHRAVAEHGSPLNIVWPHALTDNVRAMRLALSKPRCGARGCLPSCRSPPTWDRCWGRWPAG
ncbi:hypothetical protein JJQ59_03605 [Cupriavidus necator]|uniref:hypothetical protein n=1 Tax=Cupriavidus necator TaxID=106590 RepID=UPI0011BF5392|nr:hypothetical protein [Cupriavidus necator]QQX85058.1 hypothetical protein JJQ59_03605 [Cupriavidus necator]